MDFKRRDRSDRGKGRGKREWKDGQGTDGWKKMGKGGQRKRIKDIG